MNVRTELSGGLEVISSQDRGAMYLVLSSMTSKRRRDWTERLVRDLPEFRPPYHPTHGWQLHPGNQGAPIPNCPYNMQETSSVKCRWAFSQARATPCRQSPLVTKDGPALCHLSPFRGSTNYLGKSRVPSMIVHTVGPLIPVLFLRAFEIPACWL